MGALEQLGGAGTPLSDADSETEVGIQHHNPGQPEEVLEVQACLLDTPKAGE
jgi:hypothetical protein